MAPMDSTCLYSQLCRVLFPEEVVSDQWNISALRRCHLTEVELIYIVVPSAVHAYTVSAISFLSLFFFSFTLANRIHLHGIKFLTYNWKTEERCNSVCLKHLQFYMSLWTDTYVDTK